MRRLNARGGGAAAGLLMVAMLAVRLQLPAGLAAQAPKPPTRHVRCGGFEVVADQTSSIMPAVGPARVRVLKAGRPLWTLPDTDAGPITSVTCQDVTGDRAPELLVERYSGGAHCCSTLYVVALVPRVRLLLRYEAGNAGGYDLVDLNHDGQPELVLGDDRFAYFDDLCYACSPSSVPLVACFQNNRFVDCTRMFPSRVREEISYWTNKVREAVKQGSRDPEIQYIRGAALGLYANYALLGAEEKGLQVVWETTFTPAVMDWLKRHRNTIRLWASLRGKRLEPGR